jgi:hypothetical protein
MGAQIHIYRGFPPHLRPSVSIGHATAASLKGSIAGRHSLCYDSDNRIDTGKPREGHMLAITFS